MESSMIGALNALCDYKKKNRTNVKINTYELRTVYII